MQNLVDHMQIGRQSLYNTFGDKHTLYMRALRMYDATSHQDALGRLMDPGAGFAAIEGFLGDIVRGLSNQEDRRACFLINAILELAPRDEEVRAIGVDVLTNGVYSAATDRTIKVWHEGAAPQG